MTIGSRYNFLSSFSIYILFSTFLYFQRYGSAAIKDIVRVMDRAYEAERAVQDSDANSEADTDYPPDYEELEYEGSGADGEAAEDRRPLIFVPKGFFSDDVS